MGGPGSHDILIRCLKHRKARREVSSVVPYLYSLATNCHKQSRDLALDVGKSICFCVSRLACRKNRT
jgi:hypothetical protein